MEVTSTPRASAPSVPPFDPHARDRIEQVATALIGLCESLELRIAALERRQMEMDDVLIQMGQVPRG